MQSALEDAGLDVADPEQAWQEFGADIMARQPVVAKKQLPAGEREAVVSLGACQY
jgi:hypothetical protein